MQSGTLRIVNGIMVLPDEAVKGTIEVRDGRIVRLLREPGEGLSAGDGPSIDAEGMYVLPGLIDIHGDAIEKEVQPRPNTLFPLDSAFRELEKKLAACGITTMYHSLSLGTGLSLRGEHLLAEMVRLIHECSAARSMIRHRVHLRYEIIYQHLLPLAEQLIAGGAVHYFSYMLHAPGHGQYRRPGSFEAYVMKNQGVDREEVGAIVDRVNRLAEAVDREKLRHLVGLARESGLAVASHDDDSAEKVDEALSLGVSVAEFPLNLATAQHAASRGMHVCVGAPNVVRGGSHDLNLKAIEAIRTAAAHSICSDYYPPSMLMAIFRIAKERSELPKAVAMASLQPARAVGADGDIGSIEAGKRADLLLIECSGDYPVLRRTVVGGKTVYRSDFFHSS